MLKGKEAQTTVEYEKKAGKRDITRGRKGEREVRRKEGQMNIYKDKMWMREKGCYDWRKEEGRAVEYVRKKNEAVRMHVEREIGDEGRNIWEKV